MTAKWKDRIAAAGFWFVSLLLSALLGFAISGCAPSRQVREGQRLFAGCESAVDDRATLAAGVFVCKGARTVAPFDGNGRACGSCHFPGDNFSISVARIASLPPADPFFFQLDEDPVLLRAHGLIHVIAPGLDEFRATPKLVHLRALCDRRGNCDALGLRDDRIRNLDAFTVQAVANHLARTPARIAGEDFRVPTARELRALTAYQLSRLVADQDERTAAGAQ